jgi:uncharacterized protein (TIGR03067 family)
MTSSKRLAIRTLLVCGAIATTQSACLGDLNVGDTPATATHGDPALVGIWTGTEVDLSSGTWTLVITATTLDAHATGGEGYKGTYTADTSVDPKRLVGTITEYSVADFVGKSSYGIYRIEGTTMTFAANIPGDPTFPTAFTPNSIHQTRVFTLAKQ